MSSKYFYSITGFLLLILFTGYFGSITFFSHNHIVDGIQIVHSHPYKSQSGDNQTGHNHTDNSFALIYFISAFLFTISGGLASISVFRFFAETLPPTTRMAGHNQLLFLLSIRARAPAVVIHI